MHIYFYSMQFIRTTRSQKKISRKQFSTYI